LVFDIYDSNNYSGITVNEIQAVGTDFGNIWAGHNAGAYLFDGRNFTDQSFIASLDVRSIETGMNNITWFATGDGLYKYDPSQVPGSEWKTYLSSTTSLPSDNLSDIAIDNNNDVWVATPGFGVAKYDVANDSFLVYNNAGGYILDDSVLTLENNSKDNQMWIGTASKGIAIYDFTGTFMPINSSSGQGHPDRIEKLTLNQNGAWISTGQNLIRFQAVVETVHVINGYIMNNVTSLGSDMLGRTWIGTNGNGVFMYDGSTYTNYQIPDGLSDNVINDIEESPDGSIWLATGFGLTRISQDFGPQPMGDIKVSGYVFSEADSTPIANTNITIYFDNNYWDHYAGASTDDSGYYEVFVDTGNYKLYFEAQGIYRDEFYDDKESIEDADGLLINSDVTYLAYLSPLPFIDGKVFVLNDSSLIAPFEYNVYIENLAYGFRQPSQIAPGDTSYIIPIRDSGSYTIHLEFNPGSKYLGQTYKDTITLFNGALSQNQINFYAESGDSISGIIISAVDGQPVGDIYMVAIPADENFKLINFGKNNYPSSNSSPADGSYKISGLLKIAYKLFAFSNSENLNYVSQYYQNKSKYSDADSIILDGITVYDSINFALREGGTIAGTLLAFDDSSYIDGEIVVMTTEGKVVKRGFTRGFGEFSISGIDSGDYFLFARDNRGAGYRPGFYPNGFGIDSALTVKVSINNITGGIKIYLRPDLIKPRVIWSNVDNDTIIDPDSVRIIFAFFLNRWMKNL